jgi:repressor of nif and glnA expression
MNKDIERKLVAILEILNNYTEPVGANTISKKLVEKGIELSERAVRYHLKIMDERGLTKVAGKKGRIITEKGRDDWRFTMEFEVEADKVEKSIIK